MTTASYPIEGYDLAIPLDDGQGFALVKFEDRTVAERVARALAEGKGPRIQMDLPPDADTSGHAISDVLGARITLLDDDDDVVAHAISVRLPDARAARDFQMKMIAAGALIGTIAIASVGAQVVPSVHLSTGSTGAGSTTTSVTDYRAGEIGQGAVLADPGSGVAAYRVGEIGAGSTGVSDYRTGEIGQGAALAPDGVAQYRVGEIGAGAVAPDGVAQYRTGEIGQGAALAPDGVSQYRTGEIGAGSTGVTDYRAGEIGAGAATSESHAGWQQAPSSATDESHAGWQQAPSSATDESHAGWQQAPSSATDDASGAPTHPLDDFKGR